MKPAAYWGLTFLGACSLVFVLANIVLFTGNRVLQQDVSARQKYITESIRLNRLNNQLIELVARTSASTGDPQLRDLLSANGVTFQVTPEAAVPAKSPQEEGGGG